MTPVPGRRSATLAARDHTHGDDAHTWKLRVKDASSGATGTLNGWTLTL
ncbi:proprotein convertase P-domain-containing protein [Streptomyces sp. R28]|uniref:Proprotein convertase P-domain-containing protein n=1 Tax=Streptomyces sp. R28 TaxID=3238628 RepID=A0AB39PWK7_9ACTN